MHQNSIKDLPKLAAEKYENIFKVYLDEGNRYFYNLLEAINLPANLPDGFFREYTVEPNDTLPFISYKIYSTIDLWWIICISNNIDNPIKKIPTGTKLKIPVPNLAQIIIETINNQNGSV
jgi:hypothetical protein